MREGLQYYHRYLSAFHLERYDLVARDTERNLRLFAFVRTPCRTTARQDRVRPVPALRPDDAHAGQGLAGAQETASTAPPSSRSTRGSRRSASSSHDYQQEDREADCSELGFLLRWRREVEREQPMGPLERLEQQLELSVELEDYEEAARIRDQIRRLDKTEWR